MGSERPDAQALRITVNAKSGISKIINVFLGEQEREVHVVDCARWTLGAATGFEALVSDNHTGPWKVADNNAPAEELKYRFYDEEMCTNYAVGHAIMEMMSIAGP